METFISIIKLMPPWIAVLIGFLGLNTWRRQLKGNVEYDLARKLLKTLFELRDEINFVNSSYITAGEFYNASKKTGKIYTSFKDFIENKNEADVYIARWERVIKSFNELLILRLEVEVLWKKELLNYFDEIMKAVNYTKIDLDRKINNLYSNNKRLRDRFNHDDYDKKVLENTNLLETNIKLLEKEMKKYLKR